MHKLDDNTFGRIARGELNPGRELLMPELASLACDTADMRDNLWLLYGLAMGISRPTPNALRQVHILEIGVSDGTSTLAFLKAAHDAGTGHVTSIDIVDVPVAKALVTMYGLQDRWGFMQGDSKEVLTQLPAASFDIILIDGGHTYADANEDLHKSFRLLARGGFVLIHDSNLMAVDHDWDKPFGERGRPGCGLLTLDLAKGLSTDVVPLTGFVLPFGHMLSVFRRTEDNLGDLRAHYAWANGKGLLP